MYLTSHRVRSPQGAVGVNAFLYLHQQESLPERLDIESVAEEPPGDVVADSVQVQPGGNFVESYLDIVTDDQIETGKLHGALDSIASRLRGAGVDAKQAMEDGDVRVRFFCSRRVPGGVDTEFRRPAQVAVNLLSKRGREDEVPLVIREIRDGDTTRSELSDESLEILDDAGLLVRDFEITLRDDVRRELSNLHGSIYPLLPDLLLDPSMDTAGIFTSVEVIAPDSDEIVWSARGATGDEEVG